MARFQSAAARPEGPGNGILSHPAGNDGPTSPYGPRSVSAMTAPLSSSASFLRSLGASGAVHALTLGALSAWGFSSLDDPLAPVRGVREARLAPLELFVDPFEDEQREPVEVERDEPELDAEPADELAELDEPEEVVPETFEDPLAPRSAPEDLRWEVTRIEPPAPVLEPAVAAVPEVAASPIESELETVPATRVVGEPPRYPIASARRGEEGTVLCRIHVRADGSVGAVEIVQSSGHARLDEAAVAAIATWRFEPRREGGLAVADSLLHPVVFELR